MASMACGECNCGGVQFEIDAGFSGVFVCHCSICRRSTGSSGIAVVLVPNERFRWIRGLELVSMWTKPDTHWQTWFCRVCGSRVPGENDPTRMFVPAGTLTRGGEGLRVIHHVWVGSKAPWDEIGDAGQQHPEAFRPSDPGTGGRN
jgi:hypothetical protein